MHKELWQSSERTKNHCYFAGISFSKLDFSIISFRSIICFLNFSVLYISAIPFLYAGIRSLLMTKTIFDSQLSNLPVHSERDSGGHPVGPLSLLINLKSQNAPPLAIV